jgi:hypothetical protein
MYLAAKYKDHRWIYPGTGHPASLCGGSRFETSCAMTEERRSVIMVSLDMIMTSNDVIPVWCGRDVTVWLNGPLEVLNSWVGSHLKATHQEVKEARLLSQQWQKNTGQKGWTSLGWVHTSEDWLFRRPYPTLLETLTAFRKQESTSYRYCSRRWLGT